MNFLAHIYLSGEDREIKIGNFIGDFVKGKEMNNFNSKIKKGIELHRQIDEYTDSHSVVRESKKLLSPHYRHYSGVLVDIFYDHYLAKNWDKYHDVDLKTYSEGFYSEILKFKLILPKQVIHMLNYMIPHNWLLNYAHFDGIQKVLNGMSRRTTFNSNMEKAMVHLKFYNEDLEAHFDRFFPDLVSFSRQFLESDK